MDEGDEYVPQISQLDYSLVGGSGGPPIGIQNDPGGMLGNLGGAQMSSSTLSMSYGGGDMTVLQQQQTAQQRPLHSQLPSHASQITGMPPSMMDSSAGPMLTSGSHAQSMKTKPARRRKAANNDLCVQSAASSQQATQRYIEMSQMQGLTQMSQNPLVDQQMRHHSMQVPMQLGKPAGEMHMRQASMTPRVLDPYSQQQQQWGTYQQFRGAPGYPTQQPYTTPNAPHGVQITPPQHQYYPVQQDSRVPAYYGQQTYPHQMAQYPSQIGPPQPVQPSQQYFMDQNNGYYTSPSQMMLPPQPQNMASFHSRNATGADDWSRSKVASRYNASPAPPHYQNSLQMEIQQVQQQLQSMYDIPNRTMQIAQQIEQLQLRLQYLQQCHAECIPPTHQLQPPHAPESQQSQPVSVMQRGSEVQVSIKPDVPGHTLISVYHQYPPSSVPTTSTMVDMLAQKDCVPPEPVPSTIQNTEAAIECREFPPSEPIMRNQMASDVRSTRVDNNYVTQNDSQIDHVKHGRNWGESVTIGNDIYHPNMEMSCPTSSSGIVQAQKPTDSQSRSEQVHLENNNEYFGINKQLETNDIAVNDEPEKEQNTKDRYNGPSHREDEKQRLSCEKSDIFQYPDTNEALTDETTVPVDDSLKDFETSDMVEDRRETAIGLEAVQDEELSSNTSHKECEIKEKLLESQHMISRNDKEEFEDESTKLDMNMDLSMKEESSEKKQTKIKKEDDEIMRKSEDEDVADESKHLIIENHAESHLKMEDEIQERGLMVENTESKDQESKDDLTLAVCDEQDLIAPKPSTSEQFSSILRKTGTEDEAEEWSRDATATNENSIATSITSEMKSETTEAERTPEPKLTKGRSRTSRREIATRKRKRGESRLEEEEEENEDEEFIPDAVKRSRRRKGHRKESSRGSDVPVEYIEKRRSSRTTGLERKSYDLQAKWDEMEEDFVENDDGVVAEVKKDETLSEFVVEKIMSVRKVEDGADTYFVKYKNKSYIHCEWKTQAELETGDKRIAAKIRRFLQKRSSLSDQDDDEQFNSDFVVVERVLDVSEENESKYALVKWRSLPYEDATWEDISLVPDDKIDAMHKRHVVDPLKMKPKPRPSASEWSKIPEDTTFKDNNCLREYQFEGVNWLLYCYYNKQNCILADEMGLGKTVQTITFLQTLFDNGIHGPFLIVVPLSTIHNWQREFETWTDMNAVVYHGSAASRRMIQRYEFCYPSDDPKVLKKNIAQYDALITTFEMVVSDCDILKRMNYRVCVIDEAHRLKNRNCKLLTGGLLSFTIDHRILLTGTPLQNNIEELFSLLSFLEPEQFHSSSAFLEQFGQCQSEEQVQTLQEMLKPMMLRRLKEDVEKSLQPKEETIIEVQLSNTQKKYYRAILERNFSHLCKGSSVPSLMNAMMELRKCCNHPFLINGAEEQILTELKTNHPEWSEEEVYQNALVQSSGKLVLISKLLPKLRSDGHKVLIFSQMVRVLDIIEEYLVAQSYPFERIDGNVRGDLRQTAIDRFSRQDFDRFVFLLCTRAGGLGINLTAADTVIIFDSDWNPQNDLQAQARCHRIGQTKMVKVYRLITSNTYEREMFDKASLKLGLDKAVLQSTTALKDTSQQLSRKEVEELLKKGAYGAIMDENNEESKFSEEDIETILLRRTTTITLEAGVKGSTFAKASFNSSTNREDIDIDDPNFWSKWAKKANIDIESSSNEKELILLEPRNRKKRFEDNVYKAEGGDDSDGMESDESGSGRKKSDKKNERKKKKEDVEYRPDEFAFNKSEYFKIEKLLSQFGWGRWKAMREASDLKDAITEPDIEHMSRTLLLHCIREYRGDEKVREFVWRLIIPKGGEVNGKSSTKKKAGGLTSVYHEGWAALPEYNPPAFAVDSSFQRHVHRHSNKLLIRMHQLHILNTEVIGSRTEKIMKNATADEIDLPVESPPDSLVNGWDAECDKSLLIGSHKHGVDNYEAMREDENLCFVNKHLQPFPSSAELQSRFRKLLTLFQRKRNAAANNSMWTKREEMEFMRVLRSYGVKDDPNTIISWTRFRQLSPLLDKKSDGDLMEQLYCVLSMCTKQLGNEMSSADLERAVRVEPLSARKAQKLMHRMNMMRQIHDWMDSLPDRTSLLQLCSTEAMPNGWSTEHDEELFIVVESNGLDNISSNIAHRPIFQKIVRPEEKTLLRRVAEIYTTLQTKKWNGSASIGLLEDSDEETPASATSVTESQIQIRSKRGRKRMNLTSGSTTVQDLVGAEKEKMRALAHQSFLHRFEQLPFAAAAAMAQGAFLLPSLMSASSSVSQQAMLSSLFGLPTTVPSPPITPALSKTFGSSSSADDVLNLSTKNTNPSRKTSLVSSAGPNVGSLPQIAQCSSPSLNTTPSSSSSTVLNNLNFSELLALANLPPDTRVPVVNVEDGSKLTDERAPKVKNLGQWLSAHPKYVLDITTDLTSKSSVTSLPSASLPPKLNPENAVENSTTKATTPVGLDEVNTVKDSNGSTSTPKSAAPTPASEDVAAGPSSQPVSSPPLEPGEIPKSSASTSAPAPVLPLNSSSALSSSAAAAAVFAGLSEQPIAVFQRQTGALLSADKWPTLKTLQTWLNKHSDCNVHSSSVPLALTVLTKGYNDRMGGESLLSSSAAAASLSSSGTVSNVEALQMQMMLQQSLMNQSLLGLNAYNPLSSYAMLAAAAASGSAPSSIKSLISKDALNPMLASLMNSASNSSQLQQIQSLLALDPSLLLACQAAAKASASNRGVSDTSFLLPQMAGVVSSASSPTSSKQLQRKSSNRGRLNAVVEKLASSQP